MALKKSLVFVKSYIRKYKRKPVKKGYVFLFKNLKGKFTHFKRNKRLIVLEFKIVYKRIKEQKKPESFKIKQKKIPEWILFKTYINKMVLPALRKEYKGYKIQPMERFFHKKYNTDWIHLPTLYVYVRPCLIPRNKLITTDRVLKLYGFHNHYLIRYLFCFLNKETKTIYFQVRNIGFRSGINPLAQFDPDIGYADFNEAKDIVIKASQATVNQSNYFNKAKKKIKFLGIIAWTSYIIKEKLQYD